MPETTIHEDRHFGFREGYIRATSQVFEDLEIDSISKSPTVQDMSNGHLCPGIPLSGDHHTMASYLG